MSQLYRNKLLEERAKVLFFIQTQIREYEYMLSISNDAGKKIYEEKILTAREIKREIQKNWK
ncbi:MAG TPA: hypothetical protein PL042_01720 [Caldisericia bacterium]|nr:hypothetical protein [Caldisericia bacterium]